MRFPFFAPRKPKAGLGVFCDVRLAENADETCEGFFVWVAVRTQNKDDAVRAAIDFLTDETVTSVEIQEVSALIEDDFEDSRETQQMGGRAYYGGEDGGQN